MSARTTSDLVRHAVRTANSARHASTTTVPKKKRPNPEHGRQIFVYNHLQTNQVVYSLTKSLNVRLVYFLIYVPKGIELIADWMMYGAIEQCLPQTTPLQRQENRPARPPQRPLASTGTNYIPIWPRRSGPVGLPKTARVSPSA